MGGVVKGREKVSIQIWGAGFAAIFGCHHIWVSSWHCHAISPCDKTLPSLCTIFPPSNSQTFKSSLKVKRSDQIDKEITTQPKCVENHWFELCESQPTFKGIRCLWCNFIFPELKESRKNVRIVSPECFGLDQIIDKTSYKYIYSILSAHLFCSPNIQSVASGVREPSADTHFHQITWYLWSYHSFHIDIQ